MGSSHCSCAMIETTDEEDTGIPTLKSIDRGCSPKTGRIWSNIYHLQDSSRSSFMVTPWKIKHLPLQPCFSLEINTEICQICRRWITGLDVSLARRLNDLRWVVYFPSCRQGTENIGWQWYTASLEKPFFASVARALYIIWRQRLHDDLSGAPNHVGINP